MQTSERDPKEQGWKIGATLWSVAERAIPRGQRYAANSEPNLGRARESAFGGVWGAGKVRRPADPLAGANLNDRSDA